MPAHGVVQKVTIPGTVSGVGNRTGYVYLPPAYFDSSTPDRRLGRILFAVSVAGLAYWLQFRWHLRPALFYALAVMSPLTPVIDRVLPTPRFAFVETT